MPTYLVCYDLNRPGADYSTPFDRIKQLSPGLSWHSLDSTWIIKSGLAPIQVRDFLRTAMDPNDELLVVDITGKAAAWVGFSSDGSEWLKNQL